MAVCIDGVVEPLSRGEILADLRALQSMFGRLFVTDCVAELKTYRHYRPSRFPDGGDRRSRRPILGRPDEAWLHHRSGDGLVVDPLPVRSVEDFAAAPIFYTPSGDPLVNSVGQSILLAPGWSDSHKIKLRGPGWVPANETIDRANRWAFDAWKLWWPVLLPDRSPSYVSDSSTLWPDVVALVAERARRTILKPNEWFVEAGGQSYSLDVWRRRDEFELGGPMVTDEIAEEIGDEPEHVYAVRSAFLRDSELAAEWLAEQLAEPVDDEPSGGDESDRRNTAAKLDSDGLSPDGRTLRWGGELYPLGPSAAGVVRLLVNAFGTAFPYLHEEYLKEHGETETDIRKLVRDNGLELVVVRQINRNGKEARGMWGLEDPQKLLSAQKVHG